MKNIRPLCYPLLLIVLWSCKDTNPKTKFLPSSTGGINSVLVVINTELWNTEVGDSIRKYFAAPVPALSQPEPQFTLTQIPPQVFTGATAHARSVLWVRRDTAALAYLTPDVYAQPQKIAVITAATSEAITQQLNALAPQAITAFKTVELQEAQKRFTRSLSNDKTLQNTFGIHLNLPSLYTLGKRENNFVWMDIQIPKGSLNLIAYQIPENSLENDSTLVEAIVNIRDSIGKNYIPGPYPGTFMKTETAFLPHVVPTQINGKQAVEVRGIWDIKGYPMAGPFVTYIVNDPKNHRKLVLEGFAFAPSQPKRDYMFELEAIIKTLSFTSKSQ